MQIIKKYFFVLLILTSTVFAVFFRVFILGYSDFQQDEVRALGFMFDDKSFLEFLLTPSIGPGEFVVAKIFTFLKPASVDLHLWLRLPFALAGVLSVILLYYILQKFFSLRLFGIGFLMFCLSGYLIAFSRMVQYQSFLILFLLGSLYFIFKFNGTGYLKNLSYAGFCSSIALLFHYDSLPVILAFVIFLLIKSFALKKYKILVYFLSPFAIALLFYIPYFLTGNFWQKTLPYILNRSIGSSEALDPLYFSIKLFSIYHAKEYVFVLVMAAMLFLYNKNERTGTALILVLLLRYVNYSYNVYLVAFSIFVFLFFIARAIQNTIKQKEITDLFVIELWFYISFLFYGLSFKEPFTHTYTFLIPLFLLVSRQIEMLKIKYIVFIFLLIGSISFNRELFINTKSNYPWQNGDYIYGKMWNDSEDLRYKIGKDLGFGFGLPYNRNWRDVQNFFAENISNNKTYFSNDKDRTARFYLNSYQKTDNPDKADYLVCVDFAYSLKQCPDISDYERLNFDKSHIVIKKVIE